MLATQFWFGVGVYQHTYVYPIPIDIFCPTLGVVTYLLLAEIRAQLPNTFQYLRYSWVPLVSTVQYVSMSWARPASCLRVKCANYLKEPQTNTTRPQNKFK